MDEEHIGIDEDDEELRANARSEKRRGDEDVEEKSVSGSSKKAQLKAALDTVLLATAWNLMCRSRNVEHINWDNDVITVQLAHTKSDMLAGDDAGYKRHLYSNPLVLNICAVLSLTKYWLTLPGIEKGRSFLGSSHQYDRIRKLLACIVKKAVFLTRLICPKKIFQEAR
jgi:hypothetical protein